MRNLRRRLMPFALLLPLALLAACSGDDGDSTTINNIISGLGTDAQDTIDLNVGTDAKMFSASTGYGLVNGPDGQILVAFKQDRVISQGVGGPTGVQAFSYARLLGDTAGPVMALDDHADPNYDADYEFLRQSWNRRYVAFANHVTVTGFSDTFRIKLVVFDFQTGTFTTAALLANSFQFGLDSSFDDDLQLLDAHVDNDGLVTVLLHGRDEQVNAGTDKAIWAVQYDTATQTITRAPTLISGAFATQNQTQNTTAYFGSRIAANGDIAILFTRTEDFDPTAGVDFRAVLRSVVYSAATNTFSTAARADNGVNDGSGRPITTPTIRRLSTDAASFQYAFIQESAATSAVPAVYTARLEAGTAASFPAPTRLDTTTFASNFRVFTASQTLDIYFGRAGTSFVGWYELEDNGTAAEVGTLWMSSSSTVVAPSSANSTRLLDATQSTHAGYLHSGMEFSFPSAPDVVFDDNDNALVAFRVRDNDATPDEELHVATFNGTAFTASVPVAGNFATQLAPAAGQTRMVGFSPSSGFSSGPTPTSVLTWTTDRQDGSGSIESVVSGVVFTGLTAGTSVPLVTSTVVSASATVLSSNRFSFASKNVFELGDANLLTDSYPAFGNGNVWCIDVDTTNTSGSPTSGYQDVKIFNFNPNVHSNMVASGVPLIAPGQIDRFAGWHFHPNGDFEVDYAVMGLDYQRYFSPAVSSTGGPGAATAQLITPPDMLGSPASLPVGLHIDGYAFNRSFSGSSVTSTFVNVARRWCVWVGSDGNSQRLFAVRTR